jgi:hypothetical protein
MTRRTCSIPGCTKPHKGHGYCGTHYARWRSTGNAGSAESLRIPKPLPLCAAPGCEGLGRSPGVPYCELHYYRLYRNGQLDPVRPQRKTGGPCAVDGCDDLDIDIGMCAKHATRTRRHGDPTVCILPEDRNLARGPNNPSWAGDGVGYDGAHMRVEAAKGSASNHACIDCGNAARHWSYDHADPNELIGGRGSYPYSADPDHYVPRCVPCHKKFDLSIKRGAA